jgi:hypothetical protein
MLRSALDPTTEVTDPWEAGAQYGRFLQRILELMREHYEESIGARRFRFLVYHGSPYLEFGHTLRASLTGAETYDHLGRRLDTFFGAAFDRPQKMSMTTTLRL